jgi:LmbE family N-acetylglucosaminyl deacetylase
VSATFDHRVTGTDAGAWSGWRRSLASTGLPALPVLVLVAHPDDETLGAGGLIATAAAAGNDVQVLIASDGEASHPASPTHAAAQLAELRRVEARAALHALAPRAEVSFLGLPDGRLAEHESELTGMVRSRLAGRCLLVSTWTGDGHPDHAACARAAAAACADRAAVVHWEFPIWAWHWADPNSTFDGERCLRLDLDDAACVAKERAVACYPSQHEPLSDLPGDEVILPPGVLAHFRHDNEVFIAAAPASADGYFDRLYAQSGDPWGLGDRFYERRKRDLLLASLPRARFASGFEPGCATGLLTLALADRCDALLACDVADRALQQCAARVRHLEQVQVERRRIPEQWPSGPFDLIVISEVGYYAAAPRELASASLRTLSGDGVLVACHWRHEAPDHPRTAEQVHDALGAELVRIVHHVEEDFLLDVWSRRGVSVARAEGIVP